MAWRNSFDRLVMVGGVHGIGGGGGRASQSRSGAAASAGLGGGGRGVGGKAETKEEREKRLGTAKTIGKVAEAFGPIGLLFSKGTQALEARADPQGFQAGDPGLAPGLEGSGEGKGLKGTLLDKGATPQQAVAAQPDAAAKEIEQKRRRGRGRTQTILAGAKIAREERAKTLLGQ